MVEVACMCLCAQICKYEGKWVLHITAYNEILLFFSFIHSFSKQASVDPATYHVWVQTHRKTQVLTLKNLASYMNFLSSQNTWEKSRASGQILTPLLSQSSRVCDNVYKNVWLALSLHRWGTPHLELFALEITGLRRAWQTCPLCSYFLQSVRPWPWQMGWGLGRALRPDPGKFTLAFVVGREVEVNETPSNWSLSNLLSGRSSINASVWGKKQKH